VAALLCHDLFLFGFHRDYDAQVVCILSAPYIYLHEKSTPQHGASIKEDRRCEGRRSIEGPRGFGYGHSVHCPMHVARLHCGTNHLGEAVKRPEQDTLVIFFGTNDLAWLSKDKAIRPWKYGLRHDYQNMKTSSKAFRFAIKEVKKHCSEKSGKNFV